MQRIPHSAFTTEKAADRVFALSPTSDPTTGMKFPAENRTDRIARESDAVASAFFSARDAVIRVKNRMQSTFTVFLRKARKLFNPPSRIPFNEVKANSVFISPERQGETKVLTAPMVRFIDAAIQLAAPGDPDRVRSTVVTGRETVKKLCTERSAVFAAWMQFCREEKQVMDRQSRNKKSKAVSPPEKRKESFTARYKAANKRSAVTLAKSRTPS